MPINKCRVCGNKIFEEPLLRYDNMPKVAQFLPTARSLREDKGVDLVVCQCSGCGLVQLNSKPVSYYKQVIRAAGISQEMKEFRKKQLSSFIQKFSLKKKKIIEIGCGNGEYLSIMKQLDVDAYGLEYSGSAVAHCNRSGLSVSKGFIQNSSYKLKHAPFDAFFTLNFLEHLPSPNLFLRGVYNNLKDNAVGLVEVPNFDMILRKKLFSEFMRDHLFYFNKETLNSVFSLNGFEVIDSKVIWHEYIISAVVRKRTKLDISDFSKYQAMLKNELYGYVRKFKKVAIWGAGHQALAVISLANLSGKIKYVVDSATFKQGKFTPVTHIKIVSPDALDQDTVDAIIVMAASYSDEVSRIIHKKFGSKINVSVLRDFRLEDA